MRKALIGLIMAATVMSPIAAQAQEWRGARGERAGRAATEQRQAPAQRQAQRSESRAQRQQSRQATRTERRESRQQTRQARQQAPERQQTRQARQQAPAREQARQTRQQARQAQPAAVAQRNRSDRGNRAGRSGSIYPQAWQGNPNDPARQRYERLERQNQYRYGTREQRRDIRQDQRENRRDWRGDRRDNQRDWRGDRRADRRDWRRDWNRSGWRSDRRYNWRDWRYRNRGLYRLSPYYAPYRNYRYSRFSIGLFLQPLFYNQRYWISDPWQYRLPYAPAGTQWVRYYNDVILVDVYSGEVIDVIYNFFW